MEDVADVRGLFNPVRADGKHNDNFPKKTNRVLRQLGIAAKCEDPVKAAQ